jgi:hypothetical protein
MKIRSNYQRKQNVKKQGVAGKSSFLQPCAPLTDTPNEWTGRVEHTMGDPMAESSHNTKQMDNTQAEASNSQSSRRKGVSESITPDMPNRVHLQAAFEKASELMIEFEGLMLNNCGNKAVRQPYKAAWRLAVNEYFTVAARMKRRMAG